MRAGNLTRPPRAMQGRMTPCSGRHPGVQAPPFRMRRRSSALILLTTALNLPRAVRSIKPACSMVTRLQRDYQFNHAIHRRVFHRAQFFSLDADYDSRIESWDVFLIHASSPDRQKNL